MNSRKIVTTNTARLACHHWRCLLVCLLLLLTAGNAIADDNTVSELSWRELLIPAAELPRVLQSWPGATMVSQETFERLLQENQPPEKLPVPPQSVLLRHAQQQLLIFQERAFWKCQATAETLTDGANLLTMDTEGLLWNSAQVQGLPAMASLQEGCLNLLLPGKAGDFKLILQGEVAVSTEGAQKKLSCRLPNAVSGELKIIAPGDVILQDGPPVLKRDYDPRHQLTTFIMLPPRERFSLTLSLNQRLQQNASLVQAVTQLDNHLSLSGEELTAQVELQIHRQPITSLRFAVPDDFEVVSVTSGTAGGIASWGIDRDRILTVKTREPWSGTANLTCQLYCKRSPVRDNWHFPVFQALDCASNKTNLRLWAAQNLDCRNLTDLGLIYQPPARLTEWPPLPDVSDIRNTTLLLVASAPTAFQLMADIVERPPTVESHIDTKLQISEDDLRANIDVTIKARQGKCFQITLQLPPEWKYLAPEQQDPLTIFGMPDAAGHLSVQFPQGVEQGQEQSFTVTLRLVPPGWEQTWQEARQVTAPLLKVTSATRQTGMVTTQVQAPLQLELQTAENCRPVEPGRRQPNTHAFSYSSLPAQLIFAVNRPAPRLTAEIYTLAKVNQDHLAIVHEITYTAQQTPVREISCRLPETVPATLSIFGLPGTMVKEHRSQLDDGGRLVTMLLAAESQRPQVSIAYQVTIAAEGQRVALPLAQANAVEGQHGRLAIEGEADLDVTILDPPRPIDVGELQAVVNQPGRRLLGVFAYHGLPPSVEVVITRQPVHGLPPLLVRHNQVITTFSSGGVAQHCAQFFFRPNLPQLIVSLPEAAVLWSAVLDGEPSLLQRGSLAGSDGSSRPVLLLPLPPSEAEERFLEITYETPLPRLQRLGKVNATLPSLGYVDAAGDLTTAPSANVSWKMATPENFQPIASKGNLRPQTRATTPASPWLPKPIAAQAGKMLYAITGKISLNNGIKGLLQAFVGTSRYRSEYQLANRSISDAVHTDNYLIREEQGAVALPASPYPVPDQAIGKPSPPVPGKERISKKVVVAETAITAEKITTPIDWLSQDINKSLQIDLQVQGDQHDFDSLSETASIELTLLHQPTLRLLQLGIFLLLVSLGMLPWLRRHFSRRRLFVWLAVFALLPCLPGLTATALLGNVFFLAGLAVAALHALRFLLGKSLSKGKVMSPSPPDASDNATVLTIIFLLLLPTLFTGSQAQNAATVTDSDITSAPMAPATLSLPTGPTGAIAAPAGSSSRPDPTPVEVIKPVPLPLPNDAVIIPYGDSPGQPLPERLLPFEFYHRLRLGTQPSLPPPGTSMFSAISYSATLADNDTVIFTARLQALIPAAMAVPLPSLPYLNAVPVQVNVNGQPAAAWSTTELPAKLTLAPMPPGKHDIEISWLTNVTRRGGWRQVNLTLPAPTPAKLMLNIPEEGAEITLRSRRQNWSEQIKAGTNKVNVTLDGENFDLQWRLPASAASKDNTLATESIVDYLITDSDTAISWDVKMAFRGQVRSFFELTVPSSLHILAVTGANVRGWQSQLRDDKAILTIHLLRAAEASESFQVKLWRFGVSGSQVRAPFPFPDLAVPEAARHQLTARIRHQGEFDLQIEVSSPTARRCEPGKLTAQFPVDNDGAESWETTFTPLAVDLSIQPLPDSLEVAIQALHQLDISGQSLAGKLLLKTGRRHRPMVQAIFPATFSLDSLTGARLFRYEESIKDSRRHVILHLAPNDGPTAIYFTGRSNEPVTPGSAIPLPVIQVTDADRHETQIAVLAPDTFTLQERDLQGIKTVLPEVVHPWLAPANRPRLHLALRSRESDYHGQLQINAKPAAVIGNCVVSVHFTEALQQETCLFDLQIDGALETFSFLAPKHWRAANLEAPLLRHCRIEPDSDNDDLVRFTLTFQNQLTGKAQILLEIDRLPPAEAQEVQCLVTDLPLNCYILVENSGRDEVEATAGNDATALSQEHHLPPMLQTLRKNKQTQIFTIKNAATGRVHCQTTVRELVATAQARIGLASTTLTVTPEGFCQGETTLQIDNRIEQFLQLQLPAKARLWSVKVAGELIKPVAPPGIDADVVLIPLLKTAAGDLDYQVVVKYSVQLPPLGRLRPTNFPLPTTVNINIERTQVTLRLPVEYQWLHFTGELGQPVEAGVFHAATLHYQSKMMQRLSSTLHSGRTGSYSRNRALLNAQVVMQQMEITQMQVDDFQDAEKQLAQSQQIMRDFSTQQNLELEQQKQRQTLPARQQFKQQQAQTANEIHFAHVMAPITDNWTREKKELKQDQEAEAASFYQRQIAAMAAAKPQEEVALAREQSVVLGQSSVVAKGGALGGRQAGDMTVRAMSPAAAPAKRDNTIQKSEAAKLEGDDQIAKKHAEMSVADEVLPPPPVAAAVANLASLDVPFCADNPQRWQTFLFTTARDGTTLQAWSFSRSMLATFSYFGHFLLILLLVALALLITIPAIRRRVPPYLYSRRTLCQAGLLSLILGFLPVLGVLALLSCLIPRR